MMLMTRFFRLTALVLVLAMLSGCGVISSTPPAQSGKPGAAGQEPQTEETTQETTLPVPTAPPDGSPNDVTCKGSYTGEGSASQVVATAGAHSLTLGQLQLYYRLAVASHVGDPAPEKGQGLDTQMCPLAENLTWQQYFLQQALNTWHSHVAVLEDTKTAAFPIDPEYAPREGNHELYLNEEMPAWNRLYGKHPDYQVNDLIQNFIASLPDTLEAAALKAGAGDGAGLAASLGGSYEDLLALAQTMNYAYGYMIFARHYYTLTEVPAGEPCDDDTVTFRHILLESAAQAESLLSEWETGRKKSEATFAVLANRDTLDQGTQVNGGLYSNILKGQTIEVLDSWLFDPARAPGDTAILESELGAHLVYFSSRNSAAVLRAQTHELSKLSGLLVSSSREKLPMEVSYSDITLTQPEDLPQVTLYDFLYPDIAHEHIPEVPIYLQQDYPNSDYGAFPLASWGCGITTLAMLATYMADEYLTPPILADRYGSYCHRSGTDAMLMQDSAPELGYFLDQITYDWRVADEAIRNGNLVICLQHKGHFTRGGHYLVLHSIHEDGTVSIRDSNMFNYGRLHGHKDDHFKWSVIIPSGVQYWVYQPKITRIPACTRCGEASQNEQSILLQSYTCAKCTQAQGRLQDFVTLCAE